MNKLDVWSGVMASIGGEERSVVRARLLHFLTKGAPNLKRATPKDLEEWERELSAEEAAQLSASLEKPMEALGAFAKKNPEGFVQSMGLTREQWQKQLSYLAGVDMVARAESRAPTTEPVDRAFIARLGIYWQAVTFAHCGVEDFQKAAELMHAHLKEEEKRRPEWAEAQLLALWTEDFQTLYFFAARWAHFGLPVVQLAGHKYTAALMATSVPKEVRVKPPWRAFIIELPGGLITCDGPRGRESMRFICVDVRPATRPGEATNPDGWNIVAYGDHVTLSRVRVTTDEMRGDVAIPDREASAFSLEVNNEDERVLHILSRLVLSVCMAMSSPDDGLNDENVTRVGKDGSKREGDEPACRIYKVGRPVDLDCRPALYAYLGGDKRAPLTVQFLVRGHWRDQACGPGQVMRRTIWIKPYWKGPVDAPINVRPHVLE